MIPQEIIRKKRDKKVLSKEEISLFVKGLTDGSFSDSQVAAMSMAIFLNGMIPEETVNLTEAMTTSGDTINWTGVVDTNLVCDKHSTGGVGDKTSVILAPILAAAKIGARITLVLSPTPPVECLSQTKLVSTTPVQLIVSPEVVIASVKLTVSSGIMPFKKIAMLIAATCESEKDPSVRPFTNKEISSFERTFLSLFFLIISCGIIKCHFCNKVFN